MEINSLINNYLNSVGSSSERTTNKYNFSNANSFNTLLANVNLGNQGPSNQHSTSQVFNDNENYSNDTVKDSQNSSGNSVVANSKSINNNKTITSDDEDSKPVTKEIKDSLKESGVSGDDLNKINNLKDLKEYLSKKISDGNSQDGLNANLLLSILSALMNGSLNQNDILNLKDKITSDIETLLNNDVKTISGTKLTNGSLPQLLANFNENAKSILNGDLQKIVGALDSSKLPDKLTNQLLDQIKQQVITDVSSKIKGSENSTILPQIQKELAAAFNDTIKNLKANQKDSADVASDPRLLSRDLGTNGLELVATEKKNSESSSEDSGSKGNQSKADDSFLKSILSDNNNDKISKVTNFMAQFNNLNVNNSNISNIEDVIVSKNNFSNDMIKAFKYMETNNMKDLTIKITPKELGEVVINLTMEGENMKATITASNKDAYNLLNSNLADITNKLQNSDIKIQNLSLNLYNEDTTFFKDGSDRQGHNSKQKESRSSSVGAVDGVNEELDNSSTLENNVDILA